MLSILVCGEKQNAEDTFKSLRPRSTVKKASKGESLETLECSWPFTVKLTLWCGSKNKEMFLRDVLKNYYDTIIELVLTVEKMKDNVKVSSPESWDDSGAITETGRWGRGVQRLRVVVCARVGTGRPSLHEPPWMFGNWRLELESGLLTLDCGLRVTSRIPVLYYALRGNFFSVVTLFC